MKYFDSYCRRILCPCHEIRVDNMQSLYDERLHGRFKLRCSTEKIKLSGELCATNAKKYDLRLLNKAEAKTSSKNNLRIVTKNKMIKEFCTCDAAATTECTPQVHTLTMNENLFFCGYRCTQM